VQPGLHRWYTDEQIHSACGDEIVNLSDLFDDPADRGPGGRLTAWGQADGFHPNDRGHRLTVDRIEDALAR
jgi:lysophospholipase L1-like esterase